MLSLSQFRIVSSFSHLHRGLADLISFADSPRLAFLSPLAGRNIRLLPHEVLVLVVLILDRSDVISARSIVFRQVLKQLLRLPLPSTEQARILVNLRDALAHSATRVGLRVHLSIVLLLDICLALSNFLRVRHDLNDMIFGFLLDGGRKFVPRGFPVCRLFVTAVPIR